MKTLSCAAIALCCVCSSFTAAGELTYVDLIDQLTDLERLATVPDPGEKTQQWSSYNRDSRYDEKTGKYVNWSQNRDDNGFIRKEGDAIVMAEMKGPGCIHHIWSAMPGKGHVKIYLDGATTPAVDLPFLGYFDAKHAPFEGKGLCNFNSVRKNGGANNYVPIPYQKSCKIVADPGWGRYFYFGYRTYPKGTVVPTFTRDLSPAESKALTKANEFLEKKLGVDPAGPREGEAIVAKDVPCDSGKAATVAELDGPRAVTAIHVKLNLSDNQADNARLLRELCLRITWDGDSRPAVWAPLADFFGTGPGARKYRSLPLGLTDEGFYSYWYMPFAKKARIELVNDGRQKRSAAFRIVHAPLARPIETLTRFHAKWHRDAFPPSDPDRRAIDWTALTTEGTGRFCGMLLHVWNPKGRWWGEGDEKFFVDGEKFPSTYGTGSEDYFASAWGFPDRFESAYHSVNLSRTDWKHSSVNRWQISDDLPFQRSFDGCLEKYYANSRPTLYAATVYWYLAPGGVDPYEPAPVEERTDYFKAPKE